MKKSKKNTPGMLPEDAHLGEVVDTLSEQKGASTKGKKAGKPKESRKERRARKRSEKALKKKAQKLIVPKTVQDTIPYSRVYPDTGIIETQNGVFTKTYRLDDVNYQVAKDEEQTDMFLKYAEFMNAFDPSTRFQITVVQQNINLAEFEADTMLEMENDGLDYLREEQNDLLRGKIREGKNELVTKKYVTVSLPAVSYAAAITAFASQDLEIVTNINKIGGAVAQPLTTAKRLELQKWPKQKENRIMTLPGSGISPSWRYASS